MNRIDVIGVPASGPADLDEAARGALAGARLLIGAPRLTAAVVELTSPEATVRALPSPLRDGLRELVDAAGPSTPVAVLASGDPLIAGIGRTMIEIFGADRIRLHPAVSSVALARARMGWPAESCVVIRIEATTSVAAALHPGARLVLLSRDRDSPAMIADQLRTAGFGASTMTLLADLGTPAERRIDGTAADWSLASVPALQLICVRAREDPTAPADSAVWSRTPGLPDTAFEHDGQLSKRFQRAAALVGLRPRPGELLLDLGAGAGSVAIEWCRQDPRNRALAVEQHPERAERIRRNAQRLGADRLEVRVGAVETVIGDPALPRPDAIFVGGGVGTEVIEYGLSVLPRFGRLVVHAVTVESELIVYQAQRRFGGELTRIEVESLEPIGRRHGWKPARRVTQWTVVVGDHDQDGRDLP